MENLLLLHGALANKNQFSKLKEELKYQYNIISFDFSGHGEGAPIDKYRMEIFCNDILKAVDDNWLNKTNIFGYSMGGYAALCFAIKNPSRVKKIMTLGTRVFWDGEYAKEELLKLNPENIKEKVPAFAEELEKRHITDDWKNVLYKTAEMMVYLANEKPLNNTNLSKVKCPVKFTAGSKDKTLNEQDTEGVAELLEEGSFKVLQDVQHPFEKVPLDILVNEIKSFFK